MSSWATRCPPTTRVPAPAPPSARWRADGADRCRQTRVAAPAHRRARTPQRQATVPRWRGLTEQRAGAVPYGPVISTTPRPSSLVSEPPHPFFGDPTGYKDKTVSEERVRIFNEGLTPCVDEDVVQQLWFGVRGG